MIVVLADSDAALLDLARDAAANAYSPYSKVRVGCALQSATGATYSGCNVENASYGLTICAERNAIFAGVRAEGSGFRIARLAVIALGLEFPPCGACRQVIAEFSDCDTPIIFVQNGVPVARSIGALLPDAFRF